MSHGDLLLEVRVEEIPARMLPGAMQELGTRLFEQLMAKGLAPAEIESGFTPRRLWLTMTGLPIKERDREVLEVGPPASAAFDADGNPTAAAQGFARKFGVDVSRLERRNVGGEGGTGGKGTAKGERVVLQLAIAGRRTGEILAELIPQTLRELSWAKTMRWGNGIGPWVRPVHGVVALFDGEDVPFDLFGVTSGRSTVGHPILSPGTLHVDSVQVWKSRLSGLGIVPSPRERQELLLGAMSKRAAAHGGILVEDDELLAKLAAICEIPGVLEGSFDPKLLELPREVLTTSLRDHQSALTVEKDGALLPLFLTVMDRPDDPIGRVRAGNEWVVAARLADAAFFWTKDRSERLSEKVEKLDGIAFHQKLGSYGQKRDRLVALCDSIAASLGLDPEVRRDLSRAALLAKVDLTTEMVREFTSLQGVMGGVYAREDGEPPAVWQAIYDQYIPAGAGDALPRDEAGKGGQLLALADRIDNLVGFFGLGLVPTGSKDPFGLRRAALGAIRLARESGLAIDLKQIVVRAHAGFEVALPKTADECWGLLRPFFEDRLRYLFELDGNAYDEVEAGLRRDGERLEDLSALAARIAAIHAARDDREFLSVVLAAKRIANITRQDPGGSLDEAGLELLEERELAGARNAFEAELGRALESRDFAAALAAVSKLAPALEAFFQKVLVMDPDETKRANRLALLSALGASIGRIADLSQLVVDKSDYR